MADSRQGDVLLLQLGARERQQADEPVERGAVDAAVPERDELRRHLIATRLASVLVGVRKRAVLGHAAVRQRLRGDADERIDLRLVRLPSGAELFAAVRDVAAGKRVVSAEIQTTLAAESDAPELTPRQREMLAALVEGLANKDIVRQTGLSPSSVKFHLAELFRRLGVSTRAEAVAVAHKKQLFKT